MLVLYSRRSYKTLYWKIPAENSIHDFANNSVDSQLKHSMFKGFPWFGLDLLLDLSMENMLSLF